MKGNRVLNVEYKGMKRCGLAIFMVLLTAAVVQAEMVSIAGKQVNMRSGPGTKYAVAWELGQGFPLKVLAKQGKWIKIADFEGDVGWVYRKLVSSKPHLIVKANKGSSKRVNVRSGPGTKYRIIGKANYGVVFQTLKRGRGWVKVRHENGLTGWVKRSLLWGW